MGWFTLLGFGLVGFVLIHFFQDQNWLDLLFHGHAVIYQISFGVVFGLLIALTLLLLIELPLFQDTQDFFVDLIGPVQLSIPAIVFISFCAGFGEELFFRGAIQYWLGIWITAILFVLLHGYIQPKNWKMSVFGVLLIVASASFGYLTTHVGLLSAMVAHTVYDITMFIKINQYHKHSMATRLGHHSL